MSNYRRLISYIYAYEGGIKGKNIGFAKIETRGSQCKITVSVKKVYVGGNDIGVYLLAGDKEILLGNIFIRGGSGEFRTVVASGDVEHSGIPVDQCCGLTVHDVENTWRSYTTIWEDAVAHAAELELSNILPEKKETEESAQEARIKRAIREIEEEFPVDTVQEMEIDKKQADENREKIPGEQLRSFTENAKEQSKAFAENIRKRVEDSADFAKQKAEAWMRQQVPAEPVKTEKPPVEEPPERIHSQEEPFSSNINPIREPYQPSRDYTSFSRIPAVEYASELMPDMEKTSVETICYRADTAGFYDGEEKGETQQQYLEQAEGKPDVIAYPASRDLPEMAGLHSAEGESKIETKTIAESGSGIGIEAGIKTEAGSETAAEIGTEAGGETAAEIRTEAGGETAAEIRTEAGSETAAEIETEAETEIEVETETATEIGTEAETETAAETETKTDTETKTAAEAEPETLKDQRAQETQPVPVPGDPEELKRLLKAEEEEENSGEQVWERMRRTHTKILDFDYEKGCEILTIKPQDIGLLPREAWIYGNNSFLLHGYYNYRYLILAKLFNPEGNPRYLLGVPGHYYSNERYMASMFGFPNFVLSKNQPIEDGRFGYWYTDIKIGN